MLQARVRSQRVRSVEMKKADARESAAREVVEAVGGARAAREAAAREVMEAVGGGWSKMARCVWSALAKTSALATGKLATESTSPIMLLQRLSLTLHRENA